MNNVSSWSQNVAIWPSLITNVSDPTMKFKIMQFTMLDDFFKSIPDDEKYPISFNKTCEWFGIDQCMGLFTKEFSFIRDFYRVPKEVFIVI